MSKTVETTVAPDIHVRDLVIARLLMLRPAFGTAWETVVEVEGTRFDA